LPPEGGTPYAMSSSTQSGRGVSVEVRSLRKSFGTQQVLNGISLLVEPGEVFVVMGPSGSGKSVLLKHIIGLEKPNEGDILIDGHSIVSQEATVMEKYRLAMVFQSGALLNSLTVGDNVGLYLTEHRIRKPDEIRRVVSEKLELVGLKGIESKYPNELSGGMRKRVSIARALVIEPQLLLYDEPTSELDPLSAVTIVEEIVSLNRRIEVTSIVVTHDRNVAFGIADRIAIIHDGRILFIGTPAEVKANPDPLIQQFITADFKKEALSV
jgi:phospholipid/cholesterol/gamma-HCH transport system ATP-binding protein